MAFEIGSVHFFNLWFMLILKYCRLCLYSSLSFSLCFILSKTIFLIQWYLSLFLWPWLNICLSLLSMFLQIFYLLHLHNYFVPLLYEEMCACKGDNWPVFPSCILTIFFLTIVPSGLTLYSTRVTYTVL